MQQKGFIDPKKSITFRLVHRPQTDRTGKDALLLQPMQPSLNLQRKGFQPDLDFSMVQSSEDEQDPCSEEENLVDQSDFGVYFNDDYDYLQHLKTVGQDPNSVILSTKPTESHRGIKFVEPSDTLALDSLSSEKLFYDPKLISLEGLDQGLPRTTENDSNVDPSIKEIFVALEDEAYVEDGLDEDFFDAFNQDSLPDKYSSFAGTMPPIPEEPWISEFQKFREQKELEFSGDDSESENLSVVEDLKCLRRNHSKSQKAPSTAFSMTSSSMFRNEKLSLLDDQFDHVLAEYSDEELGELDPEDDHVLGSNEVIDPELDEMYDNFLENLHVIGTKRRVVTRRPQESLDAIRSELKDDAKSLVEKYGIVEDYVEGEVVLPSPKKKSDWDVETVLTTNSNIYNRPKIIQEISKGAPKIRFSKGMPKLVIDKDESESGDEESVQTITTNKGAPRNVQETKEEKRARKAEVKLEKKLRRLTKKANKNAFQKEEGRLIKQLPNIKLQGHSIKIQ